MAALFGGPTVASCLFDSAHTALCQDLFVSELFALCQHFACEQELKTMHQLSAAREKELERTIDMLADSQKVTGQREGEVIARMAASQAALDERRMALQRLEKENEGLRNTLDELQRKAWHRQYSISCGVLGQQHVNCCAFGQFDSEVVAVGDVSNSRISELEAAVCDAVD